MADAVNDTLAKQTSTEASQKTLGNVYTFIIAFYLLWFINHSADISLYQLFNVTIATFILPITIFVIVSIFWPLKARISPQMTTMPEQIAVEARVDRPTCMTRSQSMPIKSQRVVSSTSSRSTRPTLCGTNTSSTIAKISKIARAPIDTIERRTLSKKHNSALVIQQSRPSSPVPSDSTDVSAQSRPAFIARSTFPEQKSKRCSRLVKRNSNALASPAAAFALKRVMVDEASATRAIAVDPNVQINKVSKIKRIFSLRKHKSARRQSV